GCRAWVPRTGGRGARSKTTLIGRTPWINTMANTVLTPPQDLRDKKTPLQPEPELRLLLPRDQYDASLFRSLGRQIRERLFPEKLPPLRLTSRPVQVRDIWGEYNYKKRGVVGSTVLHTLAIGAIIFMSIYGGRMVKQAIKP